MDVTILGMEDQPNGLVRVTIGTVTFGQAIVVVPKESTTDPGFLTMLGRLADQRRNIATQRKHSANPKK